MSRQIQVRRSILRIGSTSLLGTGRLGQPALLNGKAGVRPGVGGLQKGQQAPGGHHGRAAVGDKGERDAGEGQQVLDEVIFLQNGRILLQSAVDDIRENQGKSIDALFREVFKC